MLGFLIAQFHCAAKNRQPAAIFSPFFLPHPSKNFHRIPDFFSCTLATPWAAPAPAATPLPGSTCARGRV